MRKSVWIILIILVLIVGGYFGYKALFSEDLTSQENDESNVEEGVISGDGIYTIHEGDVFLADNGWEIKLVRIGDPAPYHQMYMYYFEVYSPNEEMYEFEFNVGNNPRGFYWKYINSSEDSLEPVLNISFRNGEFGEAYDKEKEFTISSF